MKKEVMQLKLKKRNLILLLIILGFTFLTIYWLVPKNYIINYEVDKIKVEEKYNKKTKIYTFKLFYNNDDFVFSVQNKYKPKKKIISKIDSKNKDNMLCFNLENSLQKKLQACKIDDKYVMPYYNKTVNTRKNSSYNNIDIYELQDKTYLIWNYTYFLYINKEKRKEIPLFNKDVYKLDLVTKIKDYLLVPNYNENHYFNKFYLINSKNGKYDEFDINRDLYFNSYIVGTYKKFVYIYDLQKETYYELNPFKESIRISEKKILINNKWHGISNTKLKNKEAYFYNDSKFGYVLIEDNLYYNANNNLILVTNMKVDKLIDVIDENVFFISEDTLYFANIEKIEKVFSYSEWQFNHHNIYVF